MVFTLFTKITRDQSRRQGQFHSMILHRELCGCIKKDDNYVQFDLSALLVINIWAIQINLPSNKLFFEGYSVTKHLYCNIT